MEIDKVLQIQGECKKEVLFAAMNDVLLINSILKCLLDLNK